MDIVRTFLLRALPVLLALAALTAHAEPGSSAARNSNGAAQAEPLKIYAFRPHNRLFWSRFSTYLEAAADDLGVELTIIDAGNRPETMIEQAQTAVEERPDAIIFTDFDGNGEQMVRIAERAQIPIFLVNTLLRNEALAPRVSYRHWIGTLATDDYRAGRQLTNDLLYAARRKGIEQPRILAFSGDGGGLSLNRRLRALIDVTQDRTDASLVTVQQAPHAENVAALFKAAISANPDINVVWGVTDDSALVAAQTAHEMGLTRPMVFGGIDWRPESLEAMERGLVDVSIGGHVLDGALALIMVTDYLNGHDFISQAADLRSNLYAITPANLAEFRRLLHDPKQIDYRALSKTFNKTRRTYDFSIEHVSQNLKPIEGAQRRPQRSDAPAAESPDALVALTAEEQAWLKEHPVITIGGGTDWPPFEFSDADGRHRGIAADLIALVEQRLGVKIVVDNSQSWPATLNAIREGDLYAATAMAQTPQRLDRYLFTAPYAAAPVGIVVRESDAHLDDLSKLRGRRIVIPQGFADAELLRYRYPNLEMLYGNDPLDALQMVAQGKADAFVGSVDIAAFLIDRENIKGLQLVAKEVPLRNTELRMGVSKHYPLLASALQKALDSITPQQFATLQQRWLTHRSTLADDQPQLTLTPDEQRWISDHPVVRFTGDPNWLPFEAFTKEGEYIGVVAEVLKLIETSSGLHFERIPSGTWGNALEMARTGEVDVISDVPQTAELAATHQFTPSYLEVPLAVTMTRERQAFVSDLNEIADLRIVMIDRYGYVDAVRRAYPNIEFYFVENVQAALAAVNRGDYDAFVSTPMLSDYHLRLGGFTKLHIIGQLPLTMKLGFGVLNGQPELLSIMSKAVDAIPPAKRYEVTARWLRDTYSDNGGQEHLLRLATFAMIGLLILAAWTLSLQRERRRLRRAEERYELAIRSVSETIWDWDLISGDRFFSPGLFLHLGYDEDEVPTNHAAWVSLIHPEDRKLYDERVGQHSHQRQDADKPLSLEYRVRRKSGGYADVQSRGSVVAWSDGQPVRRAGVLRDITNLREAESARAASEDFLRSIFAGIDAAVYAVDVGIDGTLTYSAGNPYCEKITNKPVSEMIGRTPDEALPPFLVEPLVRMYRHAIEEGRSIVHEGMLTLPHLGDTWWLANLSPLRDGDNRVHRLIVTALDITERKRVELALAAKQVELHRLYLALEQIPILVVITDIDGTVDYVNERLVPMTGYQPDEVIGKSARMLLSDSSDRRRLVEMRRAVRTGGTWHGDLPHRRKDGSIFWAAVSAGAIRDNDGNITHLISTNEDITERRETEDQLHIFNHFAENATEGLGMSGMDTRVAYMNPALRRMLGVRSDDDAYGMSFKRFYPAEVVKRFDDEILPALMAHGTWRGELLAMRQDGSSFPTLESFFLIRDQEGRPQYIGDVMTDISDRKDAQAILERKEKQLRSILDTMPVAVGITALDGRVLYANPHTSTMFELPEGVDNAAVNRNVVDYYADKRTRKLLLKALTRGENVRDMEVEFRTYRGNKIHAMVSALHVEYDGHPAVLATSLNITDRVKAEAALRKSEAQFKQILNTIPLTIILTRLDGEIMLANARASADSGFPDLVGRNVKTFYAHAEDRNKVLQTLELQGFVESMPVVFKRSDGSLVDSLISSIPIEFSGQPAILACQLDMTDRFRMERELAEARDMAEEANRFKSEFLANMSHEIRTPLNAITGLSHLLSKTELDVKQADYIDKIQSSSHALLGLVNDILDFSRIEAGKIAWEQAPFSLDQVLQSLSDVVALRAEEKNLVLIYDVAAELPDQFVGDSLRVGQVLSNLVNNAIKFTDQGEIVLTIDSAKNDKGKEVVRFAVRDTGIGIAPERLEQLFESFTQADASVTRRYGGSGLGLAISKQLVELMGGSIGASSQPGQGSVFAFELPLKPLSGDDVETPQASVKAVLLEDHAATRDALTRMLQNMGAEVCAFSSPAELIGQLHQCMQEQQTAQVDILLLSGDMDHGDPFDALREISDEFDLDDTPVVILTTTTGREALMQLEFDRSRIAVVAKPVRALPLARTLLEQTGQLPSLADQESGGLRAIRLEPLAGDILLVEDNPINQQIAREILQSFGLHVSVAKNGEEALSQIAVSDFDLVLMDIQMPVLDGLETTRRIRQDMQITDTPIIAMTAHALTSDRDRCLAVGMNDHLTKPIDPARWYQVLKHYLEDSPRNSRTTRDRAAKVRRPSVLDAEEGIRRVDGNQALYHKLLNDFRHRYRDCATRLPRLLTGGKEDEAQRLLHNLKGVAGNVGARWLFGATSRLEHLIKNQPNTEHVEAFADFEQAASNTFVAIHDYLAQHEPAPSTPRSAPGKVLNEEQLHALFVQLAELLDAGDAEALACLQRIHQALPESARGADAELADLIEGYDFLEAKQALEELARSLGLPSLHNADG